MFALHEVGHDYDGAEVVSVPSWTVGQGEHWLLLGPSGSGKTTLLHLIGGLLRPTRGRIEVAGQRIDTLAPAELDRFRGAHIGVVFQRHHLLGALSVLDNLLAAQYLAGVGQSRARAMEVLDRLGIADRHAAMPHTLSQGQVQRVAIARAVINQPSLILADEPTASLDDANAAHVLDLFIEQARAHEATLLIATHDRRVRERITNCKELTR